MLGAAAFTLALTFGAASAMADGKALFTANCTKCHSAADVMKDNGKAAPGDKDLSKFGAKGLAKDEVVKFLKKEAEIGGKKHGKKMTLADGDLGSIVEWLNGLK
jgi:mono/diheme cytochrome c family protein